MSSGGGTTVTNSTPWSGAQPYLLNVMQQAQNTYNNQPKSLPGPSPETYGAATMVGNNINNPAVQNLQGSAINSATNFSQNGGGTNPYLDQMFGQAANQVRDYTNSQATMAGRGGSTTNQYVLGQNIGNLASQMYGNAYNTNQSNALAADQMMPSLLSSSFMPAQQEAGVGQYFDQFNQQNYNDPWSQLQQYGGAISGLGGLGGTSSQTAPGQSMLPQLLGSAMMAVPFL